jgi:hypothetical protein
MRERWPVILYLRRSIIAMAALLVAVPVWAQSPVGEELPDDYIPFTFSFTDSGLVGSSEFLQGFTITMAILRGELPASIDLDTLVAAVRSRPITGTLTYPSGRTTPIAYEIVHHRGPEEIYMKSSLGYFLWEYVSVSDDQVNMAIYWWYCPPALPADLEALETAARLLADPDHWHQKDDRDCADDEASGRWSLFCALKYASIEAMGEYNHHNTAMQTIRFVIDDLVPDHGFAHTLMDYNNASTTTHADILHVLELAHEHVAAELASSHPGQPADCSGLVNNLQ